jgi:hypothetical protein
MHTTSQRPLAAVAAAVLLCLLPAEGHAQAAATAIALGGIDKLFDHIESVNVYGGHSLQNLKALKRAPADSITPSGRAPWTVDYGLEFIFHITSAGSPLGQPKPGPLELARTARAEADAARLKAAVALLQKLGIPLLDSAKDNASDEVKQALEVIRQSQLPTYDTAKVTRKVEYKDNDGVTHQTVVELTPHKDDKDEKKLFDFDIGVGYGQLEGITARFPVEMHGNVRELPSVMVYTTLNLGPDVSIYGGLGSGLISLQDANFYFPRSATVFTNDTIKMVLPPSAGDSAFSVFSAGANTFELGSAVGVQLSYKNMSASLELGYHRRHFTSLNYSPATPIPGGLPHQLDFSGPSIELAIDIGWPNKKGKE